jgi:glycosyltransferase involved in cell wall biosynthesis
MSSGERRFVALLEILAGSHEVEFCVARFSPDYLKEEYQKYIPKLEERGINVLPVKKGIVEETLRKKKYDIGFFEFYWIGEENLHLFWKYQPQAVCVVDSVDVHFAREETQAKLGQIPWKKVEETRKRELNVYCNADITLAVSREDVTLLSEKYKVNNVVFVPNIVPTVPRKPGRRDPIAVFIGSYLWHPNCDAMKWFTGEVWPLIHQGNKQARFQIIGSSPTEEILAMDKIPGVEVLGYVPETTSYLEKAAVSVAPLRYGGGMKGKVNEALAHGLPVVSTTIGAQGFHPDNEIEMIVADEAEEFALAVATLFEDHEKQLQIGLAGQELNARHCSPEMVKKFLEEMVILAGKIQKSGVKRSNARKLRTFKMRSWIQKIKDTLRHYLPGFQRS